MPDKKKAVEDLQRKVENQEIAKTHFKVSPPVEMYVATRAMSTHSPTTARVKKKSPLSFLPEWCSFPAEMKDRTSSIVPSPISA